MVVLRRRERRKPSALITVNVTTDVSNIETFQTVQFAATVTGTSNTAVTWQLTCGAAGSVCGSITPSACTQHRTPSPPSSTMTSTDPATVTVTAISQANTSISQSVGFTIDSLNLQPYTAPVPLGTSGSNVDAICLTPAPGFCFGGTLGSLLTSNATPPAVVILSNNHVLGLSDSGTVGQAVTQPGVIETNCSTTGTITVANVSTIINLQTQPISSGGRHHGANHQRTGGYDRQYFGIGCAKQCQRSAARSARSRIGYHHSADEIVGEKRTHNRSYLRCGR